VLASIGDKSINEEEVLTFTVNASDPHDDPANGLTLSATGLPSGATFNPTTGVFSWTPTEAQQGSYAGVTFTVTDDGAGNLTDSETIVITVNEVNNAPVANGDAASTSENTGVSVDVLSNDTDVDEDDNPTNFSLDSLGEVTVSGLSTDPTLPAGVVTISGNQVLFTPGSTFDELDASDTATVAVAYTMSDDQGATSTATLVITVNGLNDAPTVTNPIADVTVNEDDPDTVIDVTAVFADVDGHDTLTLSVSGNTGTTLTSPTIVSSSLILEYLPDQYGTADITIRATDTGGAFVEDVITLTVISAQEQIQDVITDVQDLVDTGVLAGGNGNALVVKAQGAIDKLDEGKVTPAINKLNAFINQVNVFVDNGKLPHDQGQLLIEAAEAAIHSAGDGGSALITESSSRGGETQDAEPIRVAGELVTGTVWVSFEDASGTTTADHLARLDDAVAGLNATFGEYGLTMGVVEPDNAVSAHIRIEVAGDSDCGGAADGVLGCTAAAGEITLIEGWEWYVNSDASSIGQGQFDFQTIVTHELGHTLGLDHSGDADSVMHEYLAASSVRRDITAKDLALLEQGGGHGGSEALRVGPPLEAPPQRVVASVEHGDVLGWVTRSLRPEDAVESEFLANQQRLSSPVAAPMIVAAPSQHVVVRTAEDADRRREWLDFHRPAADTADAIFATDVNEPWCETPPDLDLKLGGGGQPQAGCIDRKPAWSARLSHRA